MADPRIVYCQHMIYLCDSQAREWDQISRSLSITLSRRKTPKLSRVSAGAAADDAARQDDRVDNAQGVNQPQAPAEDPNRVLMQMRMAHVIRGLILCFALGVPRTFYYLYGAYGVLVLSGALERIQSAQFRTLLTGSRPSLDLQLARLRQRQESIQKLEELEEAVVKGEPVDEDEINKAREFLSQFDNPIRPETHRFVYQLFFMFFYTLLPVCHPHPEYMG